MNDSGFGRLVGVLLSPEKTFRSIAERPTWLAPLLVLMVLNTAVGYLVNQRIDVEQMVRQQMEQRNQEVSQEQLDQAVGMAEKLGPVMTVVSGLVFAPAIYLILAAVFMSIVRLAGSEIDFQRSLSVFLYGMMPWVLYSLLALPIILSRESLDPEAAQSGVLMSNLGAFAPEDAGVVVKGLLSSLDAFSVWTLILLILGYRVVGRISTGASAAVVLTLWLLYVAGKVGLLYAFS
ncbi:MAG TPA: Yip1 family protein [Thermoanaerobaculia bacterium]